MPIWGRGTGVFDGCVDNFTLGDLMTCGSSSVGIGEKDYVCRDGSHTVVVVLDADGNGVVVGCSGRHCALWL
jgi:hypothetical protein